MIWEYFVLSIPARFSSIFLYFFEKWSGGKDCKEGEVQGRGEGKKKGEMGGSNGRAEHRGLCCRIALPVV